jgi:hypothetical protein
VVVAKQFSLLRLQNGKLLQALDPPNHGRSPLSTKKYKNGKNAKFIREKGIIDSAKLVIKGILVKILVFLRADPTLFECRPRCETADDQRTVTAWIASTMNGSRFLLTRSFGTTKRGGILERARPRAAGESEPPLGEDSWPKQR